MEASESLPTLIGLRELTLSFPTPIGWSHVAGYSIEPFLKGFDTECVAPLHELHTIHLTGRSLSWALNNEDEQKTVRTDYGKQAGRDVEVHVAL
jgi:hypothetical protein